MFKEILTERFSFKCDATFSSGLLESKSIKTDKSIEQPIKTNDNSNKLKEQSLESKKLNDSNMIDTKNPTRINEQKPMNNSREVPREIPKVVSNEPINNNKRLKLEGLITINITNLKVSNLFDTGTKGDPQDPMLKLTLGKSIFETKRYEIIRNL